MTDEHKQMVESEFRAFQASRGKIGISYADVADFTIARMEEQQRRIAELEPLQVEIQRLQFIISTAMELPHAELCKRVAELERLVKVAENAFKLQDAVTIPGKTGELNCLQIAKAWLALEKRTEAAELAFALQPTTLENESFRKSIRSQLITDLGSKVAELERERDFEKDLRITAADDLRHVIDSTRIRAEAAEASAARYRQALERYGVHRLDCQAAISYTRTLTPSGKCTCGFEVALKLGEGGQG